MTYQCPDWALVYVHRRAWFADGVYMKTELASILALEVPLVVVLGERTISIQEVLKWVPGSIFELPNSAEEDLEIRINQRPVGLGSAIKIGENFGIRVTHVGDPKQRILAMGPESASDSGSDDGEMSPEDIAAALLEGQF
ncbi:MAG: FliM/FliN family flagellar motor switch protein [Phycisphaerales bacterium]|nr:FliM/FliN family flagellar motor switch protein [Phycisphaerales bacterium]